MPDLPLVSVVMPVHNAETVVGDAIDSILEQTLKDFEFIVIDDGSTDDSGRILRKYAAQDTRIKLYSQPQSGLIASLNKHCRLARAKYIARMDADDISLPARLEKQFGFLETHPDIGVLGTWIRDVDPHRKPLIEWPVPADPMVVRWFLFFGNCIAHPSVMMRKDLLERLGYYRPEAVYVEDYDLWIRAAEVTGLANIPEVLVEYRVSQGSVSARNFSVQERHSDRLRDELISRFVSGSEPLPPALRGVALPALYDAYTAKVRPGRNQRAEIAVDVIRRTGVGFGSLRFVPQLMSFHALRMIFSLGIWCAKYRGQIFGRER
jgi:glycosyltransferase involved in cell wall biosynthesis